MRSLLFIVLMLVASPVFAQPGLSIGPGYLANDKVNKPLVGLTGTYRAGRFVPNIVASWSDPVGWEPNIVRAKVGYRIFRYGKGIVLLEGGADALRIRDKYEWFGAVTLSSVMRSTKNTRWILAGAYRPENDSWAIITRFNFVVWKRA
jgi:hypothetical protein